MGSSRRNEIEERSGWFTSYNPATDTGAETAIVVENGKGAFGNEYFILLGDHRDAYADKPLDECFEYFKNNQELISPWSTGELPDGS